MNYEQINFSGHAVERMFEKRITKNDVVEVIATGEIIAEYPDDRPFPSYLMLGFKNLRPLHVVFAVDEDSQTCHIITVYSPDSSLWSEDFKIRRS